MYAEVNRMVHEKSLRESEKQPRQQNNTPCGKMDLLPGSAAATEYNVNSPTTDTDHDRKQHDSAQMSQRVS